MIDRTPKGIDWDSQPLGQMSDRALAASLGVSPSCVNAQRAKRGIPVYTPEWQPCRVDRDAPTQPETPRSIRATDPSPPPLPSQPNVVAAPTCGELWRVLFVPDAHIPYHDATAWAVMLAAAQHWRPHIVVVLGDLVDFYQVSRHDKSPTRRLRLDDELMATRDALDQIGALEAAHKLYVFGNHEHRLETYLRTKAPELFGIVDCAELLGLARRGWTWKPYREYAHVGHMLVTHDLQQCGVTAIRHARTHAGCGVIIGHTHRAGSHWLADVGHGALPSFGFGWLGSPALADYRTRWLAEREWVHGFGTAYMSQDGEVWPRFHPIRHGRTCIEGTVIAS